MSELNVDTINEQTSANGVTIDGIKLKDSVVLTDTISEKTSATGVTIDGLLIKDGAIPSLTSGSWEKLASVSASSSATADLLQATTGYDGNTYSKFVVNGRWIRPGTDNVRLYAALYSGTSLRSGTYEHAGQYYRIDASDSGGYSQSEQVDYVELTNGTTGTGTRENVAFEMTVIPAGTGSGTGEAPATGVLTWFEYKTWVKYENGASWWVNRQGQFDSTSYVDGIKFYMSSGNIAQGDFEFYGIRR